jgi:hypothetical protein
MVLYPTCSIYVSSLLANLNARHYIRGPEGTITISNIEEIQFSRSAIAVTANDKQSVGMKNMRPPIRTQMIGSSSAKYSEVSGHIFSCELPSSLWASTRRTAFLLLSNPRSLATLNLTFLRVSRSKMLTPRLMQEM